MRLIAVCRKPWDDNRGQASIEAAFALLVAVPVILWAFEMSMYCYTMAQYQYAARAGVQYAISHGTDSPNCSGPGGSVNSTCPDAQGSAVAKLVANVSQSSGHAMAAGQVVATWPAGNNNPASQVTVVVNAPYRPFVSLPFIPHNVQGAATGEITY
jgi:Flp pilus assembly protein TadG